MDNLISKPSIIITSGGRTGTMFFNRILKKTISDSISFHEPESIGSVDSMPAYWIIKKFGLYNTTVKKLYGKWGITSISNRRMNNFIDDFQAQNLIVNERKKFVDSFANPLYIESSYHYYGLIDLLPNVFENVKVVFIVRNGRDWVRSWMDTKGFYNKSSLHTIFDIRLKPTGDDPYFKPWDKMSRFQKLCWAWVRINSYAINSITYTSNSKLFYFENLFDSANRESEFKSLIDFVTEFNGIKIDYNWSEKYLETKINAPKKYQFPRWQEWDVEMRNQFDTICNPLMAKLGYETNW